jgi:hypothetical protein
METREGRLKITPLEAAQWLSVVALLITLVWFSALGGWNSILTEKLNACLEVNRALQVTCGQYFNTSLLP